MGQQPWELQRQGRHASRGLDVKAIQVGPKRTAAKLVITRRRISQKRNTSADRNQHQQEINHAVADGTADLHQHVSQAGDGLLAECIMSVTDDLGDLQAEALRVTSTIH